MNNDSIDTLIISIQGVVKFKYSLPQKSWK